MLANVLVAGLGGEHKPAKAWTVLTNDDAVIPGDTGLTLAEQIDELTPVLGEVFRRSRG